MCFVQVCTFFTNSVNYFVYYLNYICARELVSRAPPRVSVCIGGRGGADKSWLELPEGGGYDGFGR